MRRLLRKLTGYRFCDYSSWRRWSITFRWGEVSSSLGCAFQLCMFEDHFSLNVHALWPAFFITLPFLRRWHRDPKEMMESWGFSAFGNDSVHFHWGSRTKILHAPWTWQWVRTSYLLDNDEWLHERASEIRRQNKINDPDASMARCRDFWETRETRSWHETHPFHYRLENGTLQERTATIRVEEREWRRWCFLRCPWLAKVRRSVWVEFNDEVGERSGSWKGGTIGCGTDLRRGETPGQALRRMERERVFD